MLQTLAGARADVYLQELYNFVLFWMCGRRIYRNFIFIWLQSFR